MVQTIKFSEFQGPSPVASTDIVVGLRGGENFQFTGVGSGSGAGVTRVITQIGHGLVVGNYVRINSSGLYVKTLADTPQNAELSGLVIAVADVNTFTLQVVGYVAAGVFAGLTAGSVYFLSDVALGAHSLTEPSVNGEVSLPVFWSETTTTGYLRQSRGIINGGQPPAGGGAPVPNPNIVVIIQAAHGFTVGQVLYLAAANVYALAQANTLAKASAVGVVISVTDVNTFTLQTDGYQSGYITGKVGASIYYVDPAVAGNMTTVRPVTVGQYIKQIYIAEAANSGYIQETQPIEILAVPPVSTGWTVISTTDVSGLANVDIAMTGYSRYMYVFDSVLPSTITSVGMRVSADGGATFDSGALDYDAWTYVNANTNGSLISLSSPGTVSNVLADGGVNGFIQVISPSSTTKEKAFLIDICFGDFGGGQKRSINSMGARNNTALINYVRFLQGDSNAFTSGTIKLLGTNA